VALAAGCGGDEAKPSATTARPATTTKTETVPPLSEADAVREARSAASQEAFKRDFSYATTDISATCRPGPLAHGKPSFDCRYVSPKGACTGTVRIVRLADGGNGLRNQTMKCTGPPNVGPDTSDPNFNPDG